MCNIVGAARQCCRVLRLQYCTLSNNGGEDPLGAILFGLSAILLGCVLPRCWQYFRDPNNSWVMVPGAILLERPSNVAGHLACNIARYQTMGGGTRSVQYCLSSQQYCRGVSRQYCRDPNNSWVRFQKAVWRNIAGQPKNIAEKYTCNLAGRSNNRAPKPARRESYQELQAFPAISKYLLQGAGPSS